MLTDVRVRRAKAASKPQKLFDGRGLFLLITPGGAKLWRFRYRFAGREKLLSLGAYPDVSLGDAREQREAARKVLASGVDPSMHRRAQRAAGGATFEAVARDWFAKFSEQWAPSHAESVLGRMTLHLFPFIGSRPIAAITSPELLAVLQRIEASGRKETARRVRALASFVFRYAIGAGKVERDPAADLRGMLARPVTVHRAAIIRAGESGATPTKLREIGALLRIIDGYDGTLPVRCALRLAPLVFVRPGELRKAEWTEVDFDAAQWTIPAWRMKGRRTLTVPLSRQAISILHELQPVTGHGRYVFPSGRSPQRPMSDNAVLSAFRRCDIPKEQMSGHGWRSIARTVLDEVLQFRTDLIEHQLAHAVRDATGNAYNRVAFISERTKMMQAWSDYLDELRAGRVEVSRQV